uniref:WD repeat-containing protein 26 n=1 Tax=Setaria digitata TaxID=48799 RepID=A0A915PSG6_9BILA
MNEVAEDCAWKSEELRPSTSSTGTVERGVEYSLADAADQGPPAKKPRQHIHIFFELIILSHCSKSMQSTAVQTQQQSPPKSVGQRIKETLQTSKSQLCRSPNVADTSLVSAPVSPPPLGAAEVNTIRIIGQYLKNLGLQYVNYFTRPTETVATLFAESGCRLEDTLAVRLREYILAGEWDHALGIVDKMSPFVTHLNLLRIREKLYEEKFVDLLGKERVLEALSLLTVDFPSDPAFFDRRNFLATLLYVDPKSVDVCAKTGAHRTERERNALIAEIQQLLPTTVMLPCNRLEKLLMQSWKMQCRECYLHVREDFDVSPNYILEDHQCDWDHFPMFTSQVLTKHTDEVWCAAFSRCGKYLATGSRSGAAHIWKVINEATVEPYKELIGRNSSSLLTWSDDGALIAVSAAEGHLADVHVYDVHSGTTFCIIENRANDSTVMSFVPNSSFNYRLVCADQMGHFCQYTLSKNNVKSEGKFEGYRIRAVHCLRNGSVLAADTHNRVRSYRFSDDSEVTLIEELSQISTFVVDKSERRVLIDTKLHGLRLWDLRTRTLIRAFVGAPHQDFIIHSAFGGPEQSYIATGSTDECIYVWKQSSEELIAKLAGHTARVNAVAWNPRLPQLVSCSDDCTIRIWSPLVGIDSSTIQQN